MAHVAKHTKAACGHLFAHFDREAENIGNEKIDPAKTHLNYNLAAEIQPERQGDFVRKRCSEVRCQNRKDVNVMCSWIVTAPKELLPEEHTLFFKTTFQFLCDRYGAENVVSAWVHRDETTDHLHFAFVPVVYDKKKDRYKVSAKECICKRDLSTFHQDLDRVMQQTFGRDIGILNGETREGNLTIKQLKAQQEKADELARQNEEAEKRLEATQQRLEAAERRLEAYEQPLAAVMEYEEGQPFMGRYKASEVQQMTAKAVAFDKLKAAYNELLQKYNEVLAEVKELMAELKSAIAEAKKLREELKAAQLTPDERIALATAKSNAAENEQLRRKVRQYEQVLGVQKEQTQTR
ncbi:MAG: plasmid recombination protein [Bacteroidaceae bacterium]|nr:plasmid recombination protein [Bacteroidaceae bacterium]